MKKTLNNNNNNNNNNNKTVRLHIVTSAKFSQAFKPDYFLASKALNFGAGVLAFS